MNADTSSDKAADKAFTAIRRWRIAGVILGILILLWLPIEDTHTGFVVVYSSLIAALAALRFLLPFTSTSFSPSTGRRKLPWIVYPLVGLFAGLLVTPLSLALMALKSGLHGHGAPDFTPEQVTAVIWNTPVWGAAGLLVALGGWMIFRSLHHSS